MFKYFVHHSETRSPSYTVIFRASNTDSDIIWLMSCSPGGEERSGYSRQEMHRSLEKEYIEVPVEHCGGWYEHPDRDDLIYFVYPSWCPTPSRVGWVATAYDKQTKKAVCGWQTYVADFGKNILLKKFEYQGKP